VGPAFRSSVIPASPDQSDKMKEAERRQTLIRILRILRCGSRLAARSLGGVPPRLSPKGIIPSQRLSFRPGFLGRGLHGRYRPSPVPVQGCTSHPGHNAGRHDAQAARERTANPPAGTALAPMTRYASAPCPSMSEDYIVTVVGTYVNKKVTEPGLMEQSGPTRRNERPSASSRAIHVRFSPRKRPFAALPRSDAMGH
jgi:hypothetical protein